MASKLSPATPRPMVRRGLAAEGEGISPATKKGTAIRLGDNSPKATRSPRSFGTERKTPVSRGAELQQVHEELAKTKEQLALVEKSKSNLLQDLARTKRQVEDLNSKLQEANEVTQKDRLQVEETEHTSFAAVENWQVELETIRKQYDIAVEDLQKNKQAMENLKQELFVCIEARDEAVRLAGDAMNAAECTAKRVEEMSTELLAAKGSAAPAVSAPAIALDLEIGNSSTAGAGDGSTGETSDILVAKKAELQPSLEYASQLQSEVESSKEELSLLRKLVRDQTTFEVNTQDLLATKESELQCALQDASHYRSHLESLRQELSAVQLLVVQHDRSSKETAALLLEKDTECQNALQVANQLRSKLMCVEEELSVSQTWALRYADSADALGLCQSELAAAVEAERNVRAQLLEMTSEIDQLGNELTNSKVTVKKLHMQLANSTSELEQLRIELAAAYEAQEKALIAESAALKNQSQMIKEVEKSKDGELVALASLSTKSDELKEAQGALEKANLEGIILSGFLESLKADLERKQLDLAIALGKEVKAREMLETANLDLTEMKDNSQKVSSVLNEQLASAQVAINALHEDAERQRLEFIEMARKEALASEKVIDVTRNLQTAEAELAELKRQHAVVSEESTNLATELNMNLKEVSHLRETEQSLSARVSSLMDVLEDKELEMTELKGKLDISDSMSSALLLDLKSTKAELVELKGRETCASMKATALSVVLASLTKENELRVKDLKEQEAAVIAHIETLNGELVKTKLELEEAWTVGKVAKDAADKLQISLELATLELHHARQERQKFMSEASRSKEDAGATVVKLEEAKAEAAKVHDAKCLAEEVIQKQSQEIKSLTVDLQIAHDEGIQAKGKAEMLSNKLSAAMAEILENKEELEKVRKQFEAAKNEVEQVREEMHSKLNEERSQSPCKIMEVCLQDTPKEPELPKLEATSGQTQALRQMHPTNFENTSPEELDNLKLKVNQTEEQLAFALKEIENFRSNNHIMLQNFETMKKEKETNERTLLEVHQHLADTEKAKSNLEAEIQRLLDESKQWQAMKDAVDIPVHSEMLGSNFVPECRDEKPQPDFPNEPTELLVSPVHNGYTTEERTAEKQDKVMKEHIALRENFACLSSRRENSFEKDESVVRDDVSLCEEPFSVPAKKKKKTLLVRLGTLLEKKKHASQHTP